MVVQDIDLLALANTIGQVGKPYPITSVRCHHLRPFSSLHSIDLDVTIDILYQHRPRCCHLSPFSSFHSLDLDITMDILSPHFTA